MEKTIELGSRIHAQWLEAKEVALAGMQPKVQGTPREVTGTIRGFVIVGLAPGTFDPNDPPRENVRAIVEPDGGGPTVDVWLRHIRDVLPPAG